MRCRCDGKGLVKLCYEDGTPFDLGVCACATGQRIRHWLTVAPHVIEGIYGLSRDRIWALETLLDEGPATHGLPAFTQAGKQKARL